MRESFQIILLFKSSYSNPSEENVSVHEKQKFEPHVHLNDSRRMRLFKVALQENGCSCSYQTLATCAENIYYQINAKKYYFDYFMFFGVDAALNTLSIWKGMVELTRSLSE